MVALYTLRNAMLKKDEKKKYLGFLKDHVVIYWFLSKPG